MSTGAGLLSWEQAAECDERDAAARVPCARFVTYSGMGHDLPAELWPQISDEICGSAGVRTA